jgi:hypothetical protein
MAQSVPSSNANNDGKSLLQVVWVPSDSDEDANGIDQSGRKNHLDHCDRPQVLQESSAKINRCMQILEEKIGTSILPSMSLIDEIDAEFSFQEDYVKKESEKLNTALKAAKEFRKRSKELSNIENENATAMKKLKDEWRQA